MGQQCHLLWAVAQAWVILPMRAGLLLALLLMGFGRTGPVPVLVAIWGEHAVIELPLSTRLVHLWKRAERR